MVSVLVYNIHTPYVVGNGRDGVCVCVCGCGGGVGKRRLRGLMG